MFNFLVPLIILSTLIIVHEFGHFIVARRIGVRVKKFSLGFGPKLFSIKRGDTLYQLCAIPLGGYIKMAGDEYGEYKGAKDEYLAQKPKDRAKIIFAGAGLNYLLGFVFFSFALFLGIPDSTTRVGEVVPGYPAFLAGILPKDKIIAVDGKKVEFWIEMVGFIHEKKGAKVSITLSRADELIKLEMPTKLEAIETTGGRHEISLIGIKQGRLKYRLKDAFVVGLKDYLKTTIFYYKTLGLMFSGKISFKRSVAGPIGIYYITTGAATAGLGPLLYVLAILSLSLSVINLLPFPVLDGGHLAFIVLEKIRGKALNRNAEELITQVGMSLLIALALFTIYNDMVNFSILDNFVNLIKVFKK